MLKSVFMMNLHKLQNHYFSRSIDSTYYGQNLHILQVKTKIYLLIIIFLECKKKLFCNIYA